MRNNKFALKNMSGQFSPESTPTPTEVNLTDEQKMQLENLKNILNKLKEFINNHPNKVPELIGRFFTPKEKTLSNGEKVREPSQYDQLMELLAGVDPSFASPIPDWRKKQPSSSISPSTPFSLNENPPSIIPSTHQENAKK
jgi:hypothetical protein